MIRTTNEQREAPMVGERFLARWFVLGILIGMVISGVFGR